MSAFMPLADIKPIPIWQGILARVFEGRDITFAVAELDAGAVAVRHHHMNEQVGLVLQGSCDFEVGDERRRLTVGDTYVIPADVPHEAVAGADGCVLIDVFTPVRDDWQRLGRQSPGKPRWPEQP